MPPPVPPPLLEAIAGRGEQVQAVEHEPPRGYVRAGTLFGRFTTEVTDRPMLEHDAATRSLVGTLLPLRSPALLAAGPGWTLEPALPRRAPAGAAAVAATVAAALAVPGLALPAAPAGAAPRERGGARLRRRARMLRSGLRPADLLAARRLPDLPPVAAHGDFHAGNVLMADDGPWVIDWELAGQRPLGYDLLTLWPTLAAADDRAQVFEAALEQAGPAHHRAVHALRHALVVRALAAVAGASRGVGGTGPPAGALRAMLDEVRP